MRWKLVAKQVNPDGNIIDIGVMFQNGASEPIARVIYPNDKQVVANVRCTEEIMKLLRRRYNNSV